MIQKLERNFENMDRKITNEQIIAGAKRIIDETAVNMEMVDFMISDDYIGIDMYKDFIVHKLLAIAKKDIERAWDNENT